MSGGSISGLFWGSRSPTKQWPYEIYGDDPNLVNLCCPINLIRTQLKLNYIPFYAVPITGVVSVINGQTLVTGLDTFFTYDLFNGQFVMIGNVVCQVQNIIDDTNLHLIIGYTGITSTDINAFIDEEDTYLVLISQAVRDYAEQYTRRDFLTKQYITYRDQFSFNSTTLRRSKLISIDNLTYSVNNSPVIVDPSIYYKTVSNDYGALNLTYGYQWPTNIDVGYQKVQIYFTVGYGDSYRSIPQELLTGMLNHAADIYMNRGDCSDCNCAATMLPVQSKRAYEKYKIKAITGNDYCDNGNFGYGIGGY